MEIEESCRRDVVARLRRVEGQVAGIVAMIESGRDCADVVTQVAAVSRALDCAGFKIVSSGIAQCAAAAERGEDPPMDQARLERLFLALS
jgi:DNA-binding FrmR family transcriptional regulator